jgi:ABC-type nitrate/sulfonate/bicarbonate transport system ATPase subunit
MNPYIFVENLSVQYGQDHVLENVNFQADKGEFIAIVGKSGSGKTSFLNALANLIPFSGLAKLPEVVGVVFQQYALYPWLTAGENIGFGLNGTSAPERKNIVESHLQLAYMSDKKNKYPAELSGGQIQRIALARCLANNPEVLLMDEPYGALDAYTRDKMQEWLLEVWSATKKTVIFVTHNIEEAIFLADRVLVLDDGKFVQDIEVPFARPRKTEIKFTPEFNELRKSISASLG